jgi:hypothetical protein
MNRRKPSDFRKSVVIPYALPGAGRADKADKCHNSDKCHKADNSDKADKSDIWDKADKSDIWDKCPKSGKDPKSDYPNSPAASRQCDSHHKM